MNETNDIATLPPVADYLARAVANTLYFFRDSKKLKRVTPKTIKNYLSLNVIINLCRRTDIPIEVISPLLNYLQVKLPGFNVKAGNEKFARQTKMVRDQHAHIVAMLTPEILAKYLISDVAPTV